MAAHGAPRLTLDGCPLRQILIHAEVFAAVAPCERLARTPAARELGEQLGRAPIAAQGRELLAPAVAADADLRGAVSVGLTRLAAFTRWLADRRRRWSPVAELGQFTRRDDLRFARAARARFADDPELAPILERILADLEHEQDRA